MEKIFFHDGSTWVDPKAIYVHDGSNWQLVRDILTPRSEVCFYHNKKWSLIPSGPSSCTHIKGSLFSDACTFVSLGKVYLYSSGTVTDLGKPGARSAYQTEIINASNDILAACDLGIFLYSSSTWSNIGGPGFANIIIGGDGNFYASTGGATLYMYISGTTWNPIFTYAAATSITLTKSSSGIYISAADRTSSNRGIFSVVSGVVTYLFAFPYDGGYEDPPSDMYFTTENILYACGLFGLYYYDGSAWNKIQSGPLSLSYQNLITEDDRGDIVYRSPGTSSTVNRINRAQSYGRIVKMSFDDGGSLRQITRDQSMNLYAIAGSSSYPYEWISKL